MLLQKLLQGFASDIERIADRGEPSTTELHFVANALSNLADAVGDGKFEALHRRPEADTSPDEDC